MKTLYLPLKKEWYEMIESGIKTEEYREIKPYWASRLFFCFGMPCIDGNFPQLACSYCEIFALRRFGAVRFSYGYTKRTMTFECKGITIGKGNPAWGAPENEEVFIIKLGKRL